MLAASFFSLLGPSVTLAKETGWAPWLPATVGFVLGVAVIKLVDFLLPENVSRSPLLRCCFSDTSQAVIDMDMPLVGALEPPANESHLESGSSAPSTHLDDTSVHLESLDLDNGAERRVATRDANHDEPVGRQNRRSPVASRNDIRPVSDPTIHNKNLALLTLAITVHNIPEGIALGFAFGGLKSTGQAYTMNEAIMLAVALALQNIPEGMAVSVPLYRSGYVSKLKAFFLGQLSGSVEVFGAVIGAAFALLITTWLPFFLSFAAGAMIYVVLSDLLPHSTQSSSQVGLWGALFGFVLMMALDTGFS